MIEIMEQTYRFAAGRALVRPFILFSDAKHHGCSKPLERAIVDFGSDNAFGKVPQKLQEHYGIEIPLSCARDLTLKHAAAFKKLSDESLCDKKSQAKATVISETDGSMVPVVLTKKSKDKKQDGRKNKSVFYREARLTMAHEKGSRSPIFSGTLGNADLAGKHMLHCVQRVGMDGKTKIHCVGDGAAWIASRVDEYLGTNATYLVDFYHVCEYLSAAAKVCAKKSEKAWLRSQKNRLKASQFHKVLDSLFPFIEATNVPDEEAPVRACHRYLKNREDQLDYKSAIDNDLPIGSGEIESAHIYVIQKRLKLAGAFWTEENAENMLALRVSRANKEWELYWQNQAA